MADKTGGIGGIKMEKEFLKYWNKSAKDAARYLNSSLEGISEEEARARLIKYGKNSLSAKRKDSPLRTFLGQLKNPVILILLVATFISAMTGELIDASIIFGIILISSLLSFIQEYSAGNAVEKLVAQVQVEALVLRNGQKTAIDFTDVVPGDILLLSAGSLIPADGLIVDSLDFFVNQSVLTGESLPVEKLPGIVAEDADIGQRTNCVYRGTMVQSGNATVLVINTGKETEFGKIAKFLSQKAPATEFEIGIHQFGLLLTQIMFVLTLAVFAINVAFKRPVIDSLLFSVALAVGITPELLPAIIGITLSQGAKLMAKEGVIVKKLSSIENFGGMDILCTDKTGTITMGVVQLDKASDADGLSSEEVFRLAYINASLQTGMVNALDQAIMDKKSIDISSVSKAGEIPYDFMRKRLSVAVEEKGTYQLITKGALDKITAVCKYFILDSKILPLDDLALEAINKRYRDWGSQGIRVLGVATKSIQLKDIYNYDDEADMVFAGFLLFFDPPKEDVAETIKKLKANGVELRIITGDNKYVAIHTAESVGMDASNVMTGSDMMKLSYDALWNQVEKTAIFAEVDPSQKERIVLALKKRGHVVGYMGDGINDVPALHAADLGISVNTAVDAAKETASFVLLDKSLEVLNTGIELGRKTFENTIKYIQITTGANLGNMFSMAGASLFMPFLPLLPKQILLINFITDFPAIAISGDKVDPEVLKTPRKWDLKFVRNSMFVFGLTSSFFDYMTFGILLLGFKADEKLFQSAWFILSIFTELAVLLIMRTKKPFYKSRPSPLLLYSAAGVGAVTLALSYLPIETSVFNIEPIPPKVLLSLMGVLMLYAITTEIVKYIFYKKK